MKLLPRTAAAALLAVALSACQPAQLTPALSPHPAAIHPPAEAELVLRTPDLASSRQVAENADAVQVRQANGTHTALIVLGIAAAAIVIAVLASGGGGTAY